MSRNYSDTVPQTTLLGNQTGAGGLTSGDTQIVLGVTLSTYILAPFVLRIEPGAANEELVLVNSGLGTLASPYQVTRGFGDGTAAHTKPAVAHAQGVAVTHGVGAADFGATGVHGLPAAMNVSGGSIGKTSTTTINAVTTETVLEAYTILSNEMAAGSVYKVVAYGTADNSATSTSLTFRLRYGGAAGVILCTFAVTTPASLQTNKPFRVEGELTCISTGASGTARACLQVLSMSPTTVTPGVDAPSGALTIDTTVNKDLVVTAQWGAATAGNTLRADSGYAENIS